MLPGTAEAIDALYSEDHPDGMLFPISFGKCDNGSVTVAVNTKEHAEQLFGLTNGKITATVLCQHCRSVPCVAEKHYESMLQVELTVCTTQ